MMSPSLTGNTTASWHKLLRQKVIMKAYRAKTGWKLAILFIILLLYMIICALVFSALESDKDRESYEYYQTVKASNMKRYNLTQAQWIQIVEDASAISKRGFVREYKNYWNFYHSFWFTTTIVTTMGKSHFLKLYCLINTTFSVYFSFSKTAKKVIFVAVFRLNHNFQDKLTTSVQTIISPA